MPQSYGVVLGYQGIFSEVFNKITALYQHGNATITKKKSDQIF